MDRLGLSVRINDTPNSGRVLFSYLAEHYLKADFGVDAVRPKSENSTANIQHIVRDYFIPRWGTEIAEEIKALDLQRWLKALHTNEQLAWPTVPWSSLLLRPLAF